MQANYGEYEFLYAAMREAPGWNSEAVDAEILSHVEELLREAGLRAPATVLEVGCGMGNLAIPLSEKGFRVTGVDVSATAIAAARKRASRFGNAPQFAVADVTDPETYRELAELDCVVDGLCLHCLIGQDRRTALEQVSKVLRVGGFFLVVTMCGDPRSKELRARFDETSRCTHHGLVADRYLGYAEQILEELREAGFRCQYHRVVDGSAETGDQDMLIAVAVRV